MELFNNEGVLKFPTTIRLSSSWNTKVLISKLLGVDSSILTMLASTKLILLAEHDTKSPDINSALTIDFIIFFLAFILAAFLVKLLYIFR